MDIAFILLHAKLARSGGGERAREREMGSDGCSHNKNGLEVLILAAGYVRDFADCF
jgi:hypothetical protein